MKKPLLFLITVFISYLSNLSAQVTLTAETLTTCDNTTLSVDVLVTNFSNVTGTSFPVVWDPAVLQFTSYALHPSVSGNGFNNVGTGSTATGELTFAWISGNPTGITLANGEAVITITFNVVGSYSPPTDASNVTLTSMGFPSEVLQNGSLTPSPASFIAGVVSVDDNTDPVFAGCPPTVTIMGSTATWTAPTATDNCPPTSITPVLTQGMPSGSAFPTGMSTPIVYTATDAAGNTENCSFNVVIPSSQLTFDASDVTLDCDDNTVSVEVRVFNFSNISTFQFAMEWDTADLEYVNSVVPFPTQPTLNTDSAGVGLIRFTWFDPSLPFGDVNQNNSIVFTLNFQVDPQFSGNTLVEFGSTSFTTLFLDGSGNTIPNNSIVFNDATISVQDAPPTINCPAAVSATTNTACTATGVSLGNATAADDCTAMPTIANNAPSSFPLGNTTVTWTATDGASQQTSCSQIVTVTDNVPPTITCPAAVSAFAGANCVATVTLGNPTASDNCTANPALASNAPANFPLGNTTVTWTATDGANLTATCQQTVTVTDNAPPTITCPAAVSAFAGANCTANVTLGTATATDNCTASPTINSNAPATYALGSTTVTWTATDAANLSASCTQTITVTDNIPPTITCPADQLLSANASCEAMLPDYTSLAVVADNCTDTVDIIITQVPAPGTVITDTTEVMLIAEDDGGLKDTCVFDVNLVDTTNPAITCPAAPAAVDNGAGLCTAVVTIASATATDNCGVDAITNNIPSGNVFPVGTTNVTFTATDFSGNTATCQVAVVVNDTIVPVITCPADISTTSDPGDCTAVVTWATPTIVDNCASSSTVTCTPASGTAFPAGTTTVECIVEDPSGNRDTCLFDVTVLDDESPFVECRADTLIIVPAGTVDTIVEGIYRILYTDNCTFDTAYYHLTGALVGEGDGDDAGGTAFPIGTTTVTYFGVDEAGNIDSCFFDVIIQSAGWLSLTCPTDQASPNIPGSCFATFNNVVATATPSNLLQSSFFEVTGATTTNDSGLDASGDFNVGNSTVTFFAVSTSNDTLTCETFIKVIDTQAPAFTNCPTNTVTVGNTIDACGWQFAGNLVATDNCPGVSVTYSVANGTLLPLGSTNIVATASDVAGNDETCAYTVQVVDNQPPKILNCTNGSTITDTNDPGVCGANITLPNVTANDNCGTVLSFTTAPMGSGVFPVGTTQVSFTATDDKGNTAICTINVIVTDDQAPTLNCLSNQAPVNANLNSCEATINLPIPATTSDNCGQVPVIATTPIGPDFEVGVHTVSYSAMDNAGNLTTCSFTVTVIDNQPPFIPNMPADITMDTDPDLCGAFVNWTAPNFPIDFCGIETFGSSGGSPGQFFGVGVHEVDYVAIDVNGNTTVETLTITVEDNEDPTIVVCPSVVSISVTGGVINDPTDIIASFQQVDCDNIQLFLNGLTADDNCGIASFSQTSGLASGADFPIGANTITWEATDNNGNVSTCSFVINVTDIQIAPASVTPSPVCVGGDVTFTVGALAGASYLWTNGSNQTVSNQQTFSLNDVTAGQAGTYTAFVSSAVCDYQSSTQLVVNTTPIVTIIADDVLCTSGTSPLELTATSSNSTVSTWNWTFPDGTMVQGQNQTIFNPTAANAGTYTLVAINELGCSGTDSEVVEVNPPPATPTLFGSATTTCVGTQESIFTNQAYSGSVTYIWSASPMMGSGLTPINNPIVGVTPTVAGTYIYSLYVVVDGCLSDTAEWSLTVDAFPVVELDVVGETACVDGGSDLTLIDNGSGATSWMWAGPFGTLPGNTSSVVLQDVNDSFSGLYTVIAKSANGCETTASTFLNITMGLSPDAQLTASESTICEGGFVELTGTLYNGASYIWIGDGIPANSQSNNVITVSPVGTGSFTYGFAATDGACTTDTVEVTITVEVLPTVDIIVSGELNCVDGTSPITLSTNATGIANFVWTGPNGNILSNASTLTIANATSANSGIYFLDVVAAGTSCFGFGSQELVITDGLDGLTATTTFDGCEDGQLSFAASDIAGATVYQWFAPNAQVAFSTQQNPTLLDGGVNGTYTVVALNSGCTDTATVVVVKLGEIVANDGDVKGIVDVPQEFNMSDFVNFNFDDYTVNILQQPINGTVSQVRDSIFVFSPNGGFWGTDNVIVEFCNVNCPGLCDIAKITLITNYDPRECVITTVISPNDDGANDEMVVSCAEASLLNTIVIYNQWGDKVYEAAPYKNDWRGTYEGRPLPDGTYFFVFQQDPDTAPKKGFVMIYR